MEKNEIKLIVLDVDGVLTDGKLLIGSDGVEYKSFHVKDGMGISLARFHGIKIAMITGRKSESVHIRAKELRVDFLYEGITNKEEVLDEIVTTLNISLQNVFYMGDDINDLPVIKLVGFSAAPKDAADIVKRSVSFVSHFNGGNGAVREAIEIVLSYQVDYDVLVEKYLNETIRMTQ
ncbi:HAD-IIIA family hydrolase [Siminovitchia acidinfaciens]|uniref:HAD-IIIA family hydrolase n=1 Tax=Siminovitchia acidinfaciens TaxID=2321395 RepID=A0A429XW86_9BACI|nr:HAD-IIIA family hydrolase [Siminovitchia acidinfaciens]RST72609.1 HAD-IIIA family hydrolase [Siminovitchia acidinfaciens]